MLPVEIQIQYVRTHRTKLNRASVEERLFTQCSEKRSKRNNVNGREITMRDGQLWSQTSSHLNARAKRKASCKEDRVI